MPGPRRSPRPELPASGVLDWTHGHWSERQRPCIYCTKPTNLRDSRRRPAHKVCAEAALLRQVEDYAEAYENERLH